MTAFDGELPGAVVDVLRVVVGLSGALVLLMAVTTSISGCARLAFSMGAHGMLPREFGRLERRTLVSREAIAAIIVVSTAVLILWRRARGRERRSSRASTRSACCWRSRWRSSP